MRRYVIAGMLVCLDVHCAGADAIDEAQVKAAFLFNFAKFVEWPQQSYTDSRAPLTICALAPKPFVRALEQVVNGKTVDGRRLVVTAISDLSDASGCQIVFVSSAVSGSSRTSLLLPSISGILTVGDAERFAASGGMIGFKIDRGKIQLEINLEAAERGKLRISSKLLSLAQIVKTSRD